jgi:hypothetical protein
MGKSFHYSALTISIELSDSTRRIIVESPFRLGAGRIAIEQEMCWKLVAMTLNNEWLRLRTHATKKGVSGSKPETLRSAAMSSEDKAVWTC